MTIKIIGRFLDPDQVGGVVDALKNSDIPRRDMIISTYDEEKFQGMFDDVKDNHINATFKSDQDDPGQLQSFVDGVRTLSEDSGIVVFVKCAKHKAQEVKSVMEQSGAIEVRLDDE